MKEGRTKGVAPPWSSGQAAGDKAGGRGASEGRPHLDPGHSHSHPGRSCLRSGFPPLGLLIPEQSLRTVPFSTVRPHPCFQPTILDHCSIAGCPSSLEGPATDSERPLP